MRNIFRMAQDYSKALLAISRVDHAESVVQWKPLTALAAWLRQHRCIGASVHLVIGKPKPQDPTNFQALREQSAESSGIEALRNLQRPLAQKPIATSQKPGS